MLQINYFICSTNHTKLKLQVQRHGGSWAETISQWHLQLLKVHKLWNLIILHTFQVSSHDD